MIVLLSLVTASAKADAALEACEIGVLTQSMPAPDSTDVPIDLQPVLIWEGNCGLDAPVDLTLAEVGGNPLVFFDSYDFEAFELIGNAWLLEPVWGELEPNTAYQLQVNSSFGEQHLIGFTTGSGTVEPVAGGLPGVAIEYASQTKLYNGAYPVSLEVAFDSAGTSDSSVYVLRHDGIERAVVVGGATPTTVGWVTSSWEREICVTAVERDGTGAWHGPSEETCVKVEKSRGCSHTPPWLGVFAFLPLLAFRRR